MECKARHGDHQQKHQGTRVGTHKKQTKKKMTMMGRSDPDGHPDGLMKNQVREPKKSPKKREVVFSRFGQSSNFTIKSTTRAEVRTTPWFLGMEVHHW